ncbi:hypothetical protein [Celerinatantimonas sp. MCCC 1A17872]|uniref:rolling circle replication-associated protein n=1 Tax=Celerinatantimonas sp. MCCC 1A17872 TaxID=3177514 RepID=UPI0038C5B386
MIDPHILSQAVAGLEPAFFGGEYHPEVLPKIPEPKGPVFDARAEQLKLERLIRGSLQRDSRAAPPKAEDSRLVQRRKSQTQPFSPHFDARGDIPRNVDEETGEIGSFSLGARARLYYRNWSDEYRVRVEAQTSVSIPPEENSGERETSELSSAGARKIMESGAFVQAVRGGFTTFLTLTFDNDACERIQSGDTTIGKEVSRFFDNAKKMYKRGFAMAHDVIGHKNGYDIYGAECLPEETAHKDDFDYIWCAECPKGKTREINPHCHVLLRWTVDEYLFHSWAYRIERLWGQGMANLKRIHSAEAAAGYLIKALGYIAKGKNSKNNQGVIRGNRYSISKSARAPKWECIASFYADNMTAIINELRDRWRWEDAPTRAQIHDAKDQLAQKKRAYMIAQKQRRFQTAEKLKARLEQLTTTMRSGYQKIRSRQARADEYQITMKGQARITNFISWAIARRGWRATEPENPYQSHLDRDAKIEWIKRARRIWRKANEWAGFHWFHTTHEVITLDAGTMADVVAWENYAYQP